jgi:hypothetical protein
MIRAGEGGKYFSDFIKNDVVAIGWDKIKDVKKIAAKTALSDIYIKAYPKDSKVSISINVGQVWAFCNDIEKGDVVLTPNPLTRTIFIGRVRGDYQYISKPLGDMRYRHRRKVTWEKEVSRDVFSQDMRNSVGALLTIFNLDKHKDEIESILSGKDTGFAAKTRMKFPKKPKEEVAIGEPLDFEGLTNAPMEENGVIFLFGKLHERMGIRIKAIRKGFPDAAGEVWIKDRLYPRTLEFEFRSSDFKRHKHAPDKCDIIVCWEHDWRDCPKNIFVIELKSQLGHYI